VERNPKGYYVEAVLGSATDTDDATGSIVAERPLTPWPEESQVRTALASLTGTYPQRPPAYSARRVEGRRGYELARAGVAVELPARAVTVYSLELLGWDPPVVRFSATVSAGTYLRAIARDLGDRLGTAAHCVALRREWIGPFRVERALHPDAVTAATPLLTPLELVAEMPRLQLDADGARAVARGQTLPANGSADAGEVALEYEGRLVAIAVREAGRWQPRVVLEPA
jgi:tRNA pseudouridine55 synthase